VLASHSFIIYARSNVEKIERCGQRFHGYQVCSVAQHTPTLLSHSSSPSPCSAAVAPATSARPPLALLQRRKVSLFTGLQVCTHSIRRVWYDVLDLTRIWYDFASYDLSSIWCIWYDLSSIWLVFVMTCLRFDLYSIWLVSDTTCF